MIWNIFKKDARLTWHLAAAVAGLHWIAITLAAMMFNGYPGVRVLEIVLILGGLAATGFVIIAVVHHDAIPGVRQDWLIRPIRRRDLILAKLLFVVLMVQLPVLIGDIGASLASGLPLGTSLVAALQRFLVQMLVVNLPFLAFASVTRNFLEVISGSVVVGLGVAMVLGLAPITLQPTSRTGISWIPLLVAFAILISGSSVVLGLQYFRRRTFVSRALIGGTTALILLTQFVPWRPAFAVQQSLSNEPGSSRDISLRFDPSAGRFHPPAGALTQGEALSILKQDQATVRIYLPFRVAGLPVDSTLVADHVEVRLTEADGKVERFPLDRWNVRSEDAATPMGLIYPPLEIPFTLYKRIKDQPVRVEADQWLTFVQLVSLHSLPALEGKQYFPGIGLCHTAINEAETAVTVSCLEPGILPNCFAFFLEHTPTGERNPARFTCGSYAPTIMDPIIPVSLGGIGTNLPFRDLSGMAKFPVDGSKIRESRAVIQLFRAQDHFTRTLVIPEVRLSDWEAEQSNGGH